MESPDVRSEEYWKYHYNLSKVCYLECDYYSYYDRIWARSLIEGMKDFLNRYVVYTGNESDEELVVLVDLAIYLHAIEQKCILNQNIPNNLMYRERLLSNEEMNDLQAKEDECEELPEDLVIQLKDAEGIAFHEYTIKTKQD